MLKPIGILGDRNKWIDFTSVVKKEGKTIWEVLEPMLDNYIIHNQKKVGGG